MFTQQLVLHGAVCREMFMGQRPWSGLSHGQIIHAISVGKQLSLGNSCPKELKTFIMVRCG